jgi:ATPase family associated with various cellular activities (AAA)
MTMNASRFAPVHLHLRLAALNRACRAAVADQEREAQQLDRPDLAAHSVTDRQVVVLLERVDRLVTGPLRELTEPALTALDLRAEADLRAQAHQAGGALPLDTLSDRAGLTELDRQALVAVVAPELDRAYERIYAYLCDEFDRRHPSVEVLMLLTAGIEDRPTRRLALGPYGTLRRQRLLVEHGDAPSDLRQQLRLGPGVLEFLLGAPVDVRSIAADPMGAAPEPSGEVECDPFSVAELAAALRDGVADVVAVWGRPEDAEVAVAGIAAGLETRISRVPGAPAPDLHQVGAALREAAVAAGLSGALLWLPVDAVDDPPPGLLDATAEALAAMGAPVVVSAATPWRPVGVLARRRWIEARAGQAGMAGRVAAWRTRHSELSEDEATDLAARFRLSPRAAAAASMLARTGVALHRAGGPVSASELETACAAVSTPRPDGLVSVTDPRWGPRDLVLPPALHRQVLEIAAFARRIPKLTDEVGDGPLTTSQRGLKVLFTGDPGTGKTLASEVIARLLGVQLVKVDLSRVVSKWVGETAKHLDAVFHLVDGTSAVLFFDEADALFGKRAEVRHGTDRYANTEVSHLLQRFEEHDGLIVLASNLREQIDPAFTRRFHTVLHFPRPEEPERRRLWELVLPSRKGEGGVDLAALATLDLTGAGIVGSARTAALLAAVEGSNGLSMAHLAHAVARQFRSEGRLAPPQDLAALAKGDGGAPNGRR